MNLRIKYTSTAITFAATLLVAAVFVPVSASAADEMAPQLKVFSRNLNQKSDFLVLDQQFTGGSDIAIGNVKNKKRDQIVIGAGRGAAPQVQVWSKKGKLLNQFMAYSESMRNGIHVATGDLDGDGIDEIVTGADFGGGPQVRVFDAAGNEKFSKGFFAFAESFRGGIDVTVGDYDGDGKNEIAVSAGPTGKPHVRIFNKKGKWIGTEFRPFADDNTGGVVLTTANVDGGEDEELVMAIQSAGESWVKVYKGNGQVLGEWNAFPGIYTGVNVGAADIDADGMDEIAVTPRQAVGPQVKFFEGHGQLVKQFFPYDENFRGGLKVEGGYINKKNGKVQVLTVPTKNRSQGRADLTRYIEVDISEQKVRIYEYGELLKTYLVSTGIDKYPTPLGQYKVTQKIPVKDYVWTYGEDHPDNYDIKDVKWNLRYSGPYHLHYAYWHNNFGHKMSHGCTNLSAEAAEWIYNWARVGDTVINKP